jgi:LDH2 family malate/lactate/ureidoglycolate dehydrogenase
VAHFCDLDGFRLQAAAAADRIRSGQRAPGVEQLFTPGEPEWRKRERSGGHVELAPAVADMLVRFARELRVSASPLESHPGRQDTGHAQA